MASYKSTADIASDMLRTEYAILNEDVKVSCRNKTYTEFKKELQVPRSFVIPSLVQATAQKTSFTNASNIVNKVPNTIKSISTIGIGDRVKISIPPAIVDAYTEYTLNTELVIPAGTKFVAVFVSGNLNDPYLIGML